MTYDLTSFVGVRIQGGLLPADLLAKIATGTDVAGLTSRDFHLPAGESVRDAANRVWAYLRGAWTTYQQALQKLPDTDSATSVTRERFLLVLLDQLGYGRVPTTGKGGITVGEHSSPVSHLWGCVPIHLLGRIPLDTRSKGIAGAAGASPQSMVQELLNRSDDHLWAILANGTTLRLLRDSTSLVGSAYVEFDLDAIFDGDLFADFLLLYTMCHESRVEPRDAELGPASCWLEQWREDAVESGSRALNLLRDGVVDALQTLGAGFLAHPGNASLREDLAEGRLSVDDVHHALLRVVYRLLFTFVAEDRGALLDPKADPQARQRYLDYFSTERLRRSSRRRRGGRYSDRWQALTVVWRGLGDVNGLPELGLPGIGGLFEPGDLDFLMKCALNNEALQSAVRSLSLVREPGSHVLRIVDYRNLGAEELGSIYEALLEFMPTWDPATKTYQLSIASGNQRRDTGSYYTPASLVESLLDTALDPVLEDAQKSDDPEEALLTVTVCDPACGSGHFLVGAARRIAKRVAGIRTGDPEPAPEAVRSAMRDVVARCIYGVDVNPLAAELAKVSLWMETLDPGRPLGFLDAQIRVGNALIGATPALLENGLPDDAFKPLEGDDRQISLSLARANRVERGRQRSFDEIDEIFASNTLLGGQLEDLVQSPVLSLDDVHVQQQRLRAYTESAEYQQARVAADAWCAAFLWLKRSGGPKALTHNDITSLLAGHDNLTKQQRAEISRLAAQYRFFHWHVEYPHIFPTVPQYGSKLNITTGWAGGFSVMLGNPPWDQIQLDAREFFATSEPDIATNPNAAARSRAISALADSHPTLYSEYTDEVRRVSGIQHFIHTSGRYPLTEHGRLNTAPLFAELFRHLVAERGYAGIMAPTGIATDSFNQYFFRDLVENSSIKSLYDFENRKALFKSVDSRFKFCLLTIVGRGLREAAADFSFFAQHPSDLQLPNARFTLKPDEIRLLNPNTGTCPIFRSKRDAEITLDIYHRIPVLMEDEAPNGNPWGVRFMLMFMMNTDADKFRTRSDLTADGCKLTGNEFLCGSKRMLPLYEGKMIHFYDDRWATFNQNGTIRDVTTDEKKDPLFRIQPRYWVAVKEVEAKLNGRWEHDWLLGFRDICRSTDERTCIVSRIPRTAVGNKLPLLLPSHAVDYVDSLQAMLSSFAFDFVVRQKISSTSLNFYIVKQLPVLPPEAFCTVADGTNDNSVANWISKRVHRLNYYFDPTDIRCSIRAELDALFFHMYGLNKDSIDFVMETFPIIKRKDVDHHGCYLTKQMILDYLDLMLAAWSTSEGYISKITCGDSELTIPLARPRAWNKKLDSLSR
jgi:hypothetical protein